jgi:hypothetical protein
MEYSAGLTIASYEVGLRLISERRDLRGRLDLAHFAALSLACLAKQTLNKRKRLNTKLELSMRSGRMDEHRNFLYRWKLTFSCPELQKAVEQRQRQMPKE